MRVPRSATKKWRRTGGKTSAEKSKSRLNALMRIKPAGFTAGGFIISPNAAGTVASQGHCLIGDGILRGARQMPREAMRRDARVALVVSGQVGLASNQR